MRYNTFQVLFSSSFGRYFKRSFPELGIFSLYTTSKWILKFLSFVEDYYSEFKPFHLLQMCTFCSVGVTLSC